ncbi:MAG: metalloregulator ArsR/SmtB family transcription factor [Pseudomonadota bacterium]
MNLLYKHQARLLKALAHETRLLIIDRLAQGEASAGELVTLSGSSAPTVSKHLAILRAHGIVDDRREGTVVWYRLLTPCAVRFLSCAVSVMEERKDP